MIQGQRADIIIRHEGAKTVLEPHGDWTVATIGALDDAMRRIEQTADPAKLVVDLTHLGRIDTSGAYLLGRGLRAASNPDADTHFQGEHATARRLMREVARRLGGPQAAAKPAPRSDVVAVFARIGAGLEEVWLETIDTFGFLGRTLTTLGRSIVQPWRFRLTPTVHVMEHAGVNALPIIAVLSFFIGAVVAYMGANLLETFGAAVFTVELVGISVLREFGVLITAILLAGRSDSAFTASIGSMKMQQEVDAMRVLGLDPFEVLVIPRVIACVIMAPLLTFAAMIAGLFGGMIVAWSTLDISPAFFIARMNETLDWSHFWVGLSKAPVFGLVIAVIGCRQGLKVKGDVESLGLRTTASVVQAIFAVIVIDALFAMMYLELDI
ncbi:MAG: ABC transporter permease [Maricaulaceae bacterium]|nr:ABC transporter permease [Maricaulaceae bacterium]